MGSGEGARERGDPRSPLLPPLPRSPRARQLPNRPDLKIHDSSVLRKDDSFVLQTSKIPPGLPGAPQRAGRKEGWRKLATGQGDRDHAESEPYRGPQVSLRRPVGDHPNLKMGDPGCCVSRSPGSSTSPIGRDSGIRAGGGPPARDAGGPSPGRSLGGTTFLILTSGKTLAVAPGPGDP